MLSPEEIRAQQMARNMNMSPGGPPPNPGGLSPSLPQCSQCGTFHPPVRPGEICPMKPAVIKSADGNPSQQVEIDKYLVQMKIILVSQLSKKAIKDPKKLFQNMIIELTKFIENYTE